ncbi:hypothetical protein PUN28_017795 [Cardiocondyla obscurior]|uniref:Uncharacterized protein n=1 Tax=Cardiocondyla obscurior TaxID=286306 RepID=A0AAW2EKA6_9HYME
MRVRIAMGQREDVVIDEINVRGAVEVMRNPTTVMSIVTDDESEGAVRGAVKETNVVRDDKEAAIAVQAAVENEDAARGAVEAAGMVRVVGEATKAGRVVVESEVAV